MISKKMQFCSTRTIQPVDSCDIIELSIFRRPCNKRIVHIQTIQREYTPNASNMQRGERYGDAPIACCQLFVFTI